MNKVPTIITGLLAALCVSVIWVSAGRSQDGQEGKRLRDEASSNRSAQAVEQKPAVKPGMSAEEKLVRDAYARLMRYQTAARDEWDARAGKASVVEDYLTFELRDIHSGPIKEISGQALEDLVTARSGNVLSIKPTYLRQGKDPAHAYYEAEWTTAAKVKEHSDRPAGDDQLIGVDRYTSYEVTVRLRGQERTYRALALHRQGEGSLRSNSEIIDNITAEMNTVLVDESPRVRSPWNKYAKSSLYIAVTRTIKETQEAGQPLIPVDAPIGYLPGDDVSPNEQDALTMALNAACVPPRIDSISPDHGGAGATVPVIIFGSGFSEHGTNTVSVSGHGVTATDVTFNSNGTITANFQILIDASAGNHEVTVTSSGFTSNAVNFFVQIPTSLTVLNRGVATNAYPNPLANGCPSVAMPGRSGGTAGPFGMQIFIRYQVMDQRNPAQAVIGAMPLREDLFNFQVDGSPIAGSVINGQVVPSGMTEPDGTFTDPFVGACSPGSFGSASFDQILYMSTNRTRDVRNNQWVLTGRHGCGNMTNGNDVSVTVPCP